MDLEACESAAGVLVSVRVSWVVLSLRLSAMGFVTGCRMCCDWVSMFVAGVLAADYAVFKVAVSWLLVVWLLPSEECWALSFVARGVPIWDVLCAFV